MDAMSLGSPTKIKKVTHTTSDDPFLDDSQLSKSLFSSKVETEVAAEEKESSLDELRTRYVGDVDLPEGGQKFSSRRSPYLHTYSLQIRSLC